MKSREHIQKEVDLTLESLEGLHRAETMPFFYTRLMARLEQPGSTIWNRWMAWLAKPAVSLGILFLFLVLNGYLLMNKYQQQDEQVTPGTEYVAQQISYFDNSTP